MRLSVPVDDGGGMSAHGTTGGTDELDSSTGLTRRQRLLSELWDEHMKHEFATLDTEHTLDTMTADAHVNHVPVLTGGRGRRELGEFYSRHFIPTHPPDVELTEISRTIGNDRLVFEFVATFTHTTRIDWMLPGVEPTGKRVELAAVVIVSFDGDKLVQEQIYWDQASVLVQLGLLDRGQLPIVGAESARKVLDPTLPSNELITRAGW
jgi:carboxymethylenebutenolidase